MRGKNCLICASITNNGLKDDGSHQCINEELECMHCSIKLTMRNTGMIGHTANMQRNGMNECLSCMDQMDAMMDEWQESDILPHSLYAGPIEIKPEDVRPNKEEK